MRVPKLQEEIFLELAGQSTGSRKTLVIMRPEELLGEMG